VDFNTGKSLVTFLPVLDKVETVGLTESEEQSLVFIAGYVIHKLVPDKLSCCFCRLEFMTDHNMELDVATDMCSYLLDLDRGGLKWLTEFRLDVVTQIFGLFRVLVSNDFEPEFSRQPSQRQTINKLTVELLKHKILTEGARVCDLSSPKLIEYALPTLSNIFINNYSEQMNDLSNTGKRKNIQKLSSVCDK
jgi:hypothetical protein